MKEPAVLFYPTGVVHFRNLEVLKQHVPGYRFKVLLEPWVFEKAPEVLETLAPEEQVIVTKGYVSKSIWEHIQILYLSMAYPNLFRLGLVYEACRRNIPVVAIEEVNQLALNDGKINHYFLPIDYFGVPSDVELEKFLELGLDEETMMVTGWPFFNRESGISGANLSDYDIKKEYDIPDDKKLCLLILGSLKEFDIVSLETRKVRRHILETVSGGLSNDFCLLIKPHPIESPAALEEIRTIVPNAAVLKPKHRIEPLLAQADLVVNRGNSQVTLLAMLQKIPVIIVPAGLNTIFHGQIERVIADDVDTFKKVCGQIFDYGNLLYRHFPLNRDDALEQVRLLFARAVENGAAPGKHKNLYISILYAFLGDLVRANQVLELYRDDHVAQLLKPLYSGQIGVAGFEELLDYFPAPVQRWHLHALWVRVLVRRRCRPQVLCPAVELLDGFEGDVNPHYFIDDLVARIQLEYQAGRIEKAGQLLEKFYGDYAVFDYYKEAFEFTQYVYGSQKGFPILRRSLWLLKNLNKSFARKYIKDKFRL